jgi:hypothetical protein
MTRKSARPGTETGGRAWRPSSRGPAGNRRRATPWRRSTGGPTRRAWRSRHVALGEADEALRYLEQAVEIRSPFLSELGDPAYDPIRDDPRFRAIAREAGLHE